MTEQLSDRQLLDSLASMFGGPDESDIRCASAKIGKVRRDHFCMCPTCRAGHKIKVGERAAIETAIVDGQWCSSYVCVPCLTYWHQHCNDGGDFKCVNFPEVPA